MRPIPLPVHFPLRGEWIAYATPAHRVPSHGADVYGQRYAYDFLCLDTVRTGLNTCRSSPLRYFLTGLPLRDFYAWGEPIYSPFEGTVVVARDGWRERSSVHYLGVRATPVWDGFVSVLSGRRWDSWITGNHIIVKKHDAEIYVFLAHLKTGSVAVVDGQRVTVSQLLGEVGHSGHSSEPHLHFQLMDCADLTQARGLPCTFVTYDELNEGSWLEVYNGMPKLTHPIRSTA